MGLKAQLSGATSREFSITGKEMIVWYHRYSKHKRKLLTHVTRTAFSAWQINTYVPHARGR